MFGFMSGYSDADRIDFCPFCGERVWERYGDGTAKCSECGQRFGVIETDGETEE